MTDPALKARERLVLGKLAEAWNAFLELPRDQGHQDDVADFRQAIHNAQRIVMARPTKRWLEDREGYAAAIREGRIEMGDGYLSVMPPG